MLQIGEVIGARQQQARQSEEPHAYSRNAEKDKDDGHSRPSFISAKRAAFSEWSCSSEEPEILSSRYHSRK